MGRRDRLDYREQMAETDFTLATQAGPSNPLDKQLFLTISRVRGRETDRQADRQGRQANRQQQRHGKDGTSHREKDTWHVSMLRWYLPACVCVVSAPEGHACAGPHLPYHGGGKKRTNHTTLGSLAVHLSPSLLSSPAGCFCIRLA